MQPISFGSPSFWTSILAFSSVISITHSATTNFPLVQYDTTCTQDNMEVRKEWYKRLQTYQPIYDTTDTKQQEHTHHRRENRLHQQRKMPSEQTSKDSQRRGSSRQNTLRRLHCPARQQHDPHPRKRRLPRLAPAFHLPLPKSLERRMRLQKRATILELGVVERQSSSPSHLLRQHDQFRRRRRTQRQ